MKCPELTPVIWFLILFISSLALHLFIPWHFSAYTDRFFVTFFGLKALCISGLITFFTQRAFRRHRTPYAPGATPTFLLETGMYAISRHPVYLALVVAMTGMGGVLDTPWLLTAALILWACLDRCVIPGEEHTLHETFGADYERYKTLTRRWL